MLAFNQRSYDIRPAQPAESSLIDYLRLTSLLSLEMPTYSLSAIRALMGRLPDIDVALVEAGHYFVADQNGDLLAGAGWSLLPLRFRAERLLDGDGRPASLSLAPGSVLLRGLFLDPDLGRGGAGASLLAEVEADAARAGHVAAEIVIPATAQLLYRSLGFRPVRKLSMALGAEAVLPLLQMRRIHPMSLPAAA